MLPPTSVRHYVTGIPALSVPVDGELADWRLGTAFSGRVKPVPIAGKNMPSTEHLWGTDGVEEQSAYLIGSGIIDHGPVFVATPARAIADVVYMLALENQNPAFLNVDQTHMSDRIRLQLVTMLRTLMEREPMPIIQKWIADQPELSRLMALPPCPPAAR